MYTYHVNGTNALEYTFKGEKDMDDEAVYILTIDNELDDGYENIAVSKTFEGLIEQFNDLLETDFEVNRLTNQQMEELKNTWQTKFVDEYETIYALDIEQWYL